MDEVYVVQGRYPPRINTDQVEECLRVGCGYGLNSRIFEIQHSIQTTFNQISEAIRCPVVHFQSRVTHPSVNKRLEYRPHFNALELIAIP
ncbi:hypothetical protein D3C75_891990 [compost metagenome]